MNLVGLLLRFVLSSLTDRLATNVLHLVILPTERCNFRCTYCYEDFIHDRMSQPVVDGLLALLSNRAGDLDQLSIEWFGGEPLLAPSIIERVQRHVVDLQDRFPHLDFDGSMTTNGYLLTLELLEQLTELGVHRYQISMDGLAGEHDSRRLRADGAGTFHRVWANIAAASRSSLDFKILLRIHVDQKNYPRLSAFLDFLAPTLAGDERFELLIRPVSRLGGPRDSELPVLRTDQELVIGELKDHAARLGLGLRQSKGPMICYASAANSFVIRSNGDIAKCTVAFRHPNNRIGRLLPDGRAELDNRKIQGWVRGLFSGDAEELRCPMKGFADSESMLLPVIQ